MSKINKTTYFSGNFACSRRPLSRLLHQHFGISIAALRMELANAPLKKRA